MDRTLIQRYGTGIVQGMIAQARSVAAMDHNFLKGRFREIFVSNVLERFLTSQFGIGSGVVVNQRGEQSGETDIIIYDNRILPPFIREERLGVFPLEAVIATIEVKSWLEKADLEKAQNSASEIRNMLRTGSIYVLQGGPKKLPPIRPPLAAVIGLNNKFPTLDDEGKGKKWLDENTRDLMGVCVVDGFSWLRLSEGWALQRVNEFSEETKRFIAVILDNVRTIAETNYHALVGGHWDWIGAYVRDNPSIKQLFDQSSAQHPDDSTQP